MAYFLIPHNVTSSTATLWIGDNSSNGGTTLVNLAPDSPGTVTYEDWRSWPQDGSRAQFRHRRVTVTRLQAGTQYLFTLVADGQVTTSARLKTLPDRLPMPGVQPFTVLLGSCFSVLEDSEGRVGNTFFRLPSGSHPDIKIFAGDQVYLDSPASYFSARTHTTEQLRALHLDTYLSTWGQRPGFGEMLVHGANYFCPDDHEYWNNAPNSTVIAMDTWSPFGNKESWLNTARQLYQAFQTPESTTTFNVPPVSFFVADTRTNRSGDRERFMSDVDLNAVAIWIEGLRGPGVLVLGQPVLSTPSGYLKGAFFDWSLPDYKQYSDLIAVLGRAVHDLVILTGDVHFGRIAICRLPSGLKFIEIISSPMSLVDKAAIGNWKAAPEYFPATGVAGLSRARSETVMEFAPTDGHFVTLEFTRHGAGARLGVRMWPILQGSTIPAGFGRQIWQTTLQ